MSSNVGKQACSTWSKPVTSYLYENEDGGLTRVEYVNQTVVVEDYDSFFALLPSRTVPTELSGAASLPVRSITSWYLARKTPARAATRFDMVSILDKAIPASQMQAINTVADGYIPDLALGDPLGPVVYKWYRAGALAGDSQHCFNGGDGITRAEVSVILCQLAGAVDRIKL